MPDPPAPVPHARMQTPPLSTLALPPALTYLLSRALADYRRTAPGGQPRTLRLGGLFRDTARYLESAGATRAEIEAVLRDAVTVAGAAHDPVLHTLLLDAAAYSPTSFVSRIPSTPSAETADAAAR